MLGESRVGAESVVSSFWGGVGKGPEELVCLFCIGVTKLGDVGDTRGRLGGEGCRKFQTKV